jgi:hypothetical protein
MNARIDALGMANVEACMERLDPQRRERLDKLAAGLLADLSLSTSHIAAVDLYLTLQDVHMMLALPTLAIERLAPLVAYWPDRLDDFIAKARQHYDQENAELDRQVVFDCSINAYHAMAYRHGPESDQARAAAALVVEYLPPTVKAQFEAPGVTLADVARRLGVDLQQTQQVASAALAKMDAQATYLQGARR